jgi:hypothetical protein
VAIRLQNMASLAGWVMRSSGLVFREDRSKTPPEAESHKSPRGLSVTEGDLRVAFGYH